MIYSLFQCGFNDENPHHLGEIVLSDKATDKEIMSDMMGIYWGEIPWPVEYLDYPHDSMNLIHVGNEVHISLKDSGLLICKLIPFHDKYGFPVMLIKKPLPVYKINTPFYETIIKESICPVCEKKALANKHFIYKCSNCGWEDILYNLTDLMNPKKLNE